MDLSVLEYSWRNGFRFPRHLATAVGKEIDQLRAEIGEFIDPKDVLDYARTHPESALYQCFDWDQASAAEAHWLFIAGQLLRAVKVKMVVYDETRPTREVIIEERQNVHLRPLGAAPHEGKAYGAIIDTLPIPQYRAQMIEAFWTEVIRVRTRYSHLHELDEVFRRIDEALKAAGRAVNPTPMQEGLDHAEGE